ncbi:MAG: DMT family transporter [Pseudomonadota bacterium]
MLAATSLWALAYAAPLAIPDASALEIVLGRFIVYGLISLFAFNPMRLLNMPGHLLRRALLYALFGNIVYYVLLIFGMKWANAAIAVLILGMLPVTISLYGQLVQGRAGFWPLAVPLTVFSAGVVIFNLDHVEFSNASRPYGWLGLAAIIACLLMWTWYAIDNAKFLRETTIVTASQWSSVIGIVSLGIALVALPVSWGLGLARDPTILSLSELSEIAIWSILLGAGATWLGTTLFNLASRLLATPILGQLILFEVFFGLIYVFLLTGQGVGPFALLGSIIALLGLWLSVRSLQSRK